MRRWQVIAIVIAVLSGCGCGGGRKSPTTPTGQSTTFRGTIAGTGAQSGTVDVTVQTTVTASASFFSPFFQYSFATVLYAQTASATGTLHLVGGSTTSLNGAYSSSTNSFNLSGGAFNLTGNVASGAISGTYSGPNSSVGGFSALNATSNMVTRFCGTWTSASGESGTWNLQTSTDGTVSGVGISNVPPPVFITGRVNGSALTIATSEGGTGTGTVQGDTVTGTGRSGGTGERSISFSGSTTRCN